MDAVTTDPAIFFSFLGEVKFLRTSATGPGYPTDMN